MAQLTAICTSPRKGTAKARVEQARLMAGHGIEGDAHAGPWHRQVSMLDEASITEMRQAGANIDDGAFGENLIVDGLAVHELGIGSEIAIGSARLAVTQIGKACHKPCIIFHTVGRCIMPARGVFMEVVESGDVACGDEVRVTRALGRDVIQVAIVTVSDRSSRGERADGSGPALAERVVAELGANVAATKVVPDDQQAIVEVLRDLTSRKGLDLVLTTGGTGCAPRDVTPEATRQVVTREVPGLAEQMRAQSLLITPRAMLSRGIAGIAERCLVINLPGSPKAAVENLRAVAAVLPHAVATLRGVVRDCADDPD